MDADAILAEMQAKGLPSPKVRLGDTKGYYWVSATVAEPHGQTHTYSVRLGLDPAPLDVEIAATELKSRVQDE